MGQDTPPLPFSLGYDNRNVYGDENPINDGNIKHIINEWDPRQDDGISYCGATVNRVLPVFGSINLCSACLNQWYMENDEDTD